MVTAPSAPTLTLAARQASGSRSAESSTICPSPVTSSMECSAADRLRSRAPVPCVPVAVAPAIDCAPMSPRFSNARPWSHIAPASSPSVIPASTRTWPLARSTSTMRRMFSSVRSVPSVRTASVKECPAPATRTWRPASAARSIAATTPAVLLGRSMTAGVHVWSPVQLRHGVGRVIDVDVKRAPAPPRGWRSRRPGGRRARPPPNWRRPLRRPTAPRHCAPRSRCRRR